MAVVLPNCTVTVSSQSGATTTVLATGVAGNIQMDTRHSLPDILAGLDSNLDLSQCYVIRVDNLTALPKSGDTVQVLTSTFSPNLVGNWVLWDSAMPDSFLLASYVLYVHRSVTKSGV